MNGNNNTTEDEDTNTNDIKEELKSRSVSGEYYARGCAELATESALTLAKIEHVSRINLHDRDKRDAGGGRIFIFLYSCCDEDS
jgi:hypothetical protein